MGDKQRLTHILEAVSEIESYIFNQTFEEFQNNSMMRFAAIKQIEIIGEASNYLSEELKNNFPEIEWRKIVGLRHILVHEYFGIDAELIWQIVKTDIPNLKSKVEMILLTLQKI